MFSRDKETLEDWKIPEDLYGKVENEAEVLK